MTLDGEVRIAAMQAELERLGAKVDWPTDAPVDFCKLEVEVSAAQAWENIPEHFFDDIRDRSEPGDVADFTRACSGGDRLMARALAARLWSDDRNLAACDRALAGARA